ncbi:MAG: COX15/CtaA family protein [Flavobacteriales bacterium]|nr:COX15/CtaA family protein [Flavobacteriales bacterium]
MKDKKWVIAWLASGAIMVALMVLIGGITRLTHSGLSMSDWSLIMGAIPPLNEADWNDAFEQYKQFPEYQKLNSHFELADFKAIFFWEYLHRMIGRTIGMVFIIPFIIFLIRKSLPKKLILQSLVLFGLGALQGFLGWFMVKSGLVDRPSVSHYRLAIHLSAAFLTFCYILWVILSILKPNVENQASKRLAVLSRILVVATSIQIILGAFVAGLKAGLVFPTWPKMGEDWMPPMIMKSVQTDGMISLFDQPVSVQFLHRTFAYAVVLLVGYIWAISRKENLNRFQQNTIHFLLGMVVLQFVLGVLTLLYMVPVSLGVIHQFGALLLLSGSVLLMYGTQSTKNS